MVSEKKESLLSVDDAADSIGVTKQTVTRLIREEKLPAQKVGNKWVLREEALRDYMRDNNLVPEPKDHGCLMSEKPGIVALSFFSGALGLDLGMEAAGIEPLLYCENDRKCRMTIQAMRPQGALIGDINQYSATEILQMAGLESDAKVDVMFGGPPCQAFSTAGARRAFDDARGNVFLKYLELASEIKPTYLVIENVRGLLSAPYAVERHGQPVKGGALHVILRKLEEAGYSVSFNLYNAANFGAPQIRERVVLIGKRGESKAPYLTPTHECDGQHGLPPWKTFGEAVGDLKARPMQHTDFPEKRLKYFRMLKEGEYWKDLPVAV